MAPAPRGMRMSVAIVLMPDGGDIARVGFEEQLRHCIQPFGRLLANEADLIGRRLIERQLDFHDGPTIAALKVIPRHHSFPESSHPTQTPQIAR